MFFSKDNHQMLQFLALSLYCCQQNYYFFL